MSLPFTPESLSSLRQRYPRALAEIFDMESVMLGVAMRPGHHRTHVFDCEDGLRLIVSRERSPQGELCLHLSASARATGTLLRQLGKLSCQRKIKRRFCVLVEQRFLELSGDQRQLDFLFWGEGQIPNWIIAEESCPSEKSSR